MIEPTLAEPLFGEKDSTKFCKHSPSQRRNFVKVDVSQKFSIKIKNNFFVQIENWKSKFSFNVFVTFLLYQITKIKLNLV